MKYVEMWIEDSKLDPCNPSARPKEIVVPYLYLFSPLPCWSPGSAALSQPSVHCQMRTLKFVPCHSCASEQCGRRLGISFCTPTPLSHFLLSLLSRQGVGGYTREGRDIISTQGEAAPACTLFWDSSTMRRTWVCRDQALAAIDPSVLQLFAPVHNQSQSKQRAWRWGKDLFGSHELGCVSMKDHWSI